MVLVSTLDSLADIAARVMEVEGGRVALTLPDSLLMWGGGGHTSCRHITPCKCIPFRH